MKILYLWNTAGAFSPVAKWLNKNGHEARIVMNRQFDSYHATSALDCAILVDSPKKFYLSAAKQILFWRPDIIHVNSSKKGLILARLLAWFKPIIFTYHGSEIRGKKKWLTAKLASFVHVTSSDLKEYGTHLERPVDSMFYYRGERVLNTAGMYYAIGFTDKRKMAEEWCSKKGVDLIFIQFVPHEVMPFKLSIFEYYLDFKGLDSISLTALEALACGCKVVHDSDPEKIITEYPVTKPEDYLELYQSLLNGRRYE